MAVIVRSLSVGWISIHRFSAAHAEREQRVLEKQPGEFGRPNPATRLTLNSSGRSHDYIPHLSRTRSFPRSRAVQCRVRACWFISYPWKMRSKGTLPFFKSPEVLPVGDKKSEKRLNTLTKPRKNNTRPRQAASYTGNRTIVYPAEDRKLPKISCRNAKRGWIRVRIPPRRVPLRNGEPGFPNYLPRLSAFRKFSGGLTGRCVAMSMKACTVYPVVRSSPLLSRKMR